MARPTTQPQADATTEQLVRDHLPLVHCVVADTMRKIPRHVTRDELTSAALLGLVQAAKAYDPDRGVTFQRFARVRIEGALVDELRSRDWASRSVRSRARQLQSATERLEGSLGRTPTPAEIAEQMGVSADEVARLHDDVHRATVLNYDSVFVEADHVGALASHTPGPMEALIDREKRAYLMDAIVALPERLQRVIVGYFFDERPMQELADELGVTESRISQMRAEALILLKEGMTSQLDPEKMPASPAKPDRVSRRKASYYAAVASASDFRSRLDATPEPIQQRVKRTAVSA
jgi:RNA polymerase sigma factor FliA